MLGTVKRFDDKHGYGFISCLGIDEDIFVHYSQVKVRGRKVLHAGQEVSFTLVRGERGPQAENVRVIEE